MGCLWRGGENSLAWCGDFVILRGLEPLVEGVKLLPGRGLGSVHVILVTGRGRGWGVVQWTGAGDRTLVLVAELYMYVEGVWHCWKLALD